MSTPVLNNGIFVRDTKYESTSHVDSYHLLNMMNMPEPMDFGVVDLWAMTQKVEMPLYQLASFNGKNTIEVDHPKGEWKWEQPITVDLPYITEDVEPGREYLGEDGTSFKIKLNKRAFGHGDIITYDKYSGAELYITAESILPSNDGFIYTVELVNRGNSEVISKEDIAPGTQFHRKASARGEYGEEFADMSIESGVREFYNFVGQSEAHVTYSISSRAALMARGGIDKNGNVPVTEIWRYLDKGLDPSITDLNSLVGKMGKDGVKKAVKDGKLGKSFVTQLEAAHLSKIAKDVENYIMWGKGGRIKQNGPDDIRLSVGLWDQLDSSFKRIYNKGGFSLDLFRSEIFNFYNGKVEFNGPDPKRQIIVQTGMAGMKMVSAAIQREAFGTGLTVNMEQSGVNAISGKNAMDLNFGFAFTSYTIPFLANVKFVLNPAFDSLHTNDRENPIIDGYPLSSYSFIIFDITDGSNDNIYLLKNKWDNQLKWWYSNGTMDYMGRTQGFQSSSRKNGFEVFMTQPFPAVWVKDPTKVLKIVMRNPVTGSSL